MCKYSPNVIISSGKSVYCVDFVSKFMIPPEPSGIFFHFHLNKPQVLCFGNFDEDLDVACFNKPKWFAFVEGFTTFPFLLERVSIWWILPLSFRTLGSDVALLPLFFGLCWFPVMFHQDSRSVPRFSDANTNLEVDVMEMQDWKVDGAIMRQKKLKSSQYVTLAVTDYNVCSLGIALRGMYCKSSRYGPVIYVVINRLVMEVYLPIVFDK